MNAKNLIFTLAAALVVSLMLLLSAAPAFADNPLFPLDATSGTVVIPPVTTQPAAPPPPPPAADTATIAPSYTATTSAPAVPPAGSTRTRVRAPSTFSPTAADMAGYSSSDNHTGPHPFHPHPHTNWPNNGYYPGYNPGVTWPNSYYSWSGDYPYIGTYPYPAVPDYQQPQPVYYAPVISSFTANPNYVQAGQLATLSWNVSNADLVSISPSIGSVAATGSFSVIPAYTTTYTLTASNNQGNVTATTTVTVAPYAATYGNTYGTGSIAVPATTGLGTYSSGSAGSTGNTVNTSGVTAGTPTAANLWLMYLLLIGLLAVAAVVIIALLVRKPAAARAGSNAGAKSALAASATAPSSALPATSTPVTAPVEVGLPAKFVSPGGTTMPVTGKPLGRRDFQALMPPDSAGLVSRQHILVTYENSQYSIEDLNSTNGTKLNGSEIRGTGKHAIASGDTVELAGVFNLTFKV
jgi:hypothetical protein